MDFSEDEMFGDERILADQPQYLAEINIFERVGYETISATTHEIQTDPVKRFRVFVNATASNFSANKILPINRGDVEEINRKAELVQNPRYKNPIGFILGYYLVKDGEISAANLSFIRKNLAILSMDKFIKIEDVLRYGRLWSTQLM